MITSDSHKAGGLKRLGHHLKGHIFLFDAQTLPTYAATSGFRLLLIFILMEAVIGPRFSLFHWLGLRMPPAWIRIPVLLGLALILIRYFAQLRLEQIGLFAWKEWRTTQKSYFIQVVIITNVVFCIIMARPLHKIFADPGLRWLAVTVMFTNLLWGFYQELIYRGILQTELVRRWGPWVGVLVSNLIFTLGPLHFYHLANNPLEKALPILAGVFITGLLFAILFQRSGNLIIVGVLHGLGNCYIDGLGPLGR